MKTNLIKVKVDPKDFKSIAGILHNQDLLEGEPVELELSKKEIFRCMNFAEVYDLTYGEEVLIDEVNFKEIPEYVEDEEVPEEEPETPSDEPVEDEDDAEPAKTETPLTDDTVVSA